LDANAEVTNLLPGLLDSPPHQEDLSHQPPPTSALEKLCDSYVVAPPPPLLPQPFSASRIAAVADHSTTQDTPPATDTSPQSVTVPPPPPPPPSAAAPDTSTPQPPPTLNATTPVLPEDIPPTLQAAERESVKRRSVRLGNRPPSSVGPAVRARDTKLKKLGLVADAPDAKEDKKQQMLLKYTGPDSATAEEALQDLLGLKAQKV
jgi:hypothetical protein